MIEKYCQQVMTNLLGNSAKFTPNGGKVSIKARKLDPNESDSLGEMLKVSVTYTVSGIRASEHGIIFQKFMQAGRNRTEFE